MIATSWDLQFLNCLAESTRPKSAIIDVEDMKSGTVASKTGSFFYDTLKSIVRLNNCCHPDMIRDFVEHGTHDPEEFPFIEEIHALRRLVATLYSLRNWSTARAYATLHTWHVRDFILITQVDMANFMDCFTILQVRGLKGKMLNSCCFKCDLF